MSAPLWKAEQVIRAVRGKGLHEQSWEAQGVSIDSRTVKAGDLFVALEGPSHDGHDYVSNAFAAGAVAALVSHQPKMVAAEAPVIFVDDTLTALENLGYANRRRSKASVIAVTGSVGKTSSKEMLRQMLSAVGDTYANEGSLNNHWGVPLSLARLPVEARFGVFELGMNHAGELGPLSRLVEPQVSLITTVEPVHIEFFSSVEAIADAKAEIFYGMKPDSAVALNRDNGQFERLYNLAAAQGIKRIHSFGYVSKADAQIIACTPANYGSDVRAEVLGKKIHYQLGAAGEHLAINSIGALLTAVLAGGDLDACAAALREYKQPKGRGVVQEIPVADGKITIIDESYNASPVSVRAAIRVLSQMKPLGRGRKIMALGDMKELGEAAPSLHAGLAKSIVESKIDRVFCCGEMMAHLHECLPPDVRGAYASDSVELASYIADDIHAGDIISVKGSHSVRMDRVVEALKAMAG